MNTERKKILMLAAHEPNLDPRIHWAATYAAQDFQVTVLGVDAGSEKQKQDSNDYTIIRKQKPPIANREILTFVSYLFKASSRLFKVLATFSGIILFPLIVVLEILYVLIKYPLRLLKKIIIKCANRLRTVNFAVGILKKIYQALFITPINSSSFYWILRYHYLPVTKAFWSEITSGSDVPDIIHCNDLDTLLVGVLAKKYYGCRIIYDAHEYWPHSDPDAHWLFVKFFKAYEKVLIKNLDCVVTVNPLMAEVMKNDYKIKNVYSIPNAEPLKPTDLHKPNTSLSELAAGRVKFLFQGNFAPQRGIEELLNAWRKIDRTKAALFLRGPKNASRDICVNYAKALGLLNEGVYFIDAVSEDLLVAAASEADVGIIPYKPVTINYKYACPNKLSQYMQAGLMVISNDLPYMRRVVEAGEIGLLYDTANETTIIHALNTAIDDVKLRDRCKENALIFAKDKFNWQIYYDTLKNLYNRNESMISSDQYI